MAFVKGQAAVKREAVVHLYRGVPSVRKWSKHKQTDKNWSLCGVRETAIRKKDRRESFAGEVGATLPHPEETIESGRSRTPLRASEDISEVTCPFCLELAYPWEA